MLAEKARVDVAEFTPDNEAGRVNLFQGYRASKTINVAASASRCARGENCGRAR